MVGFRDFRAEQLCLVRAHRSRVFGVRTPANSDSHKNKIAIAIMNRLRDFTSFTRDPIILHACIFWASRKQVSTCEDSVRTSKPRFWIPGGLAPKPRTPTKTKKCVFRVRGFEVGVPGLRTRLRNFKTRYEGFSIFSRTPAERVLEWLGFEALKSGFTVFGVVSTVFAPFLEARRAPRFGFDS